MSARTKARKHALDVLFSSELRDERPLEALQRVLADSERPTPEYAVTLVRGVAEHQEQIDALLTSYSQDWTLARMPAVDRNVLRLGVFELLHADDVPDAVAVSEAMALVRELSTDESPQFVNGVLGTIQRNKASILGE